MIKQYRPQTICRLYTCKLCKNKAYHHIAIQSNTKVTEDELLISIFNEHCPELSDCMAHMVRGIREQPSIARTIYCDPFIKCFRWLTWTLQIRTNTIQLNVTF